MIISVVTHDVSDDCNSVPLARNDVYLRITRLGQAFAFHYSEDGTYWRMVRYFTLRQTADLRAGFSSQSPTGAGCHVIFDHIQYSPRSGKDVRSGEERPPNRHAQQPAPRVLLGMAARRSARQCSRDFLHRLPL